MTTQVVLHPKQAEVRASTAKNKVLEAARRGGKSRVAFWEMHDDIRAKMQEPVSIHQQPPYLAWIVTPTFPQSNQVWTEMMAFLPQAWVDDVSATDKQVYLKGTPGGKAWGLIEVKSAHNPDSLQTAGLDFLWVTEAQDIDNAAFNKMAPMLHSPGRALHAVWEGIPSLWRDHWFWRICEHAENGAPGYSYHHWTCYDNPMLSPEQIEEIEAERSSLMTDDAWRRMYLAERTESAGFFKNIRDAIAGDILAGPMPGARYVAGLDLGRLRDASVLWILDANQRKGVYHQRWDAGEDWAYQREGIVYAANLFGVDRMHVDATGMGGDMFCETLEAEGLPIERYNIQAQRQGADLKGSRMDVLNNFAIAMERHDVTFPHVDQLLREMRAFQWLKKGNGLPRPDHPDGEHDDEIFAFGMALLLCEESAPQVARRSAGKMSYMPRAGENRSAGAQLLREAKLERMRQRWERSGVVL